MNFVKKIIRYLKLLKAFSIISLMDQMAYPHNFWLAIITKTLRIAIIMLFFKAIYLKVNNISGWGFGEALFIFATFSLIDFIANVTFFRNFLFWFSKYLKNGFFDYRMVKPANLQFMTAFQQIDFMDLTTILPTLLLYWYALNRMTAVLSIVNSILYFVLLANAILFIYSFVLILSTFNFWTIRSTGWGRFAAGILWMARYPT
ncbi:ABC-2 family transporter protein, partial [Patescibacteria group bacterium]|nr:ABC-2 family transporter protein [Patescibacteria group bacterium]